MNIRCLFRIKQIKEKLVLLKQLILWPKHWIWNLYSWNCEIL